MTPYQLLLGDHGTLVLLGAIGLVALLVMLAAGFEIVQARTGGMDPASLPDWLEEHGPALLVAAGLPALLLACGAAAGLTLSLGGNPERADLRLGWLLALLVDLGVVVAVIAIGLGSPLKQHWGLSVTAFGAAVGLLFPLLWVINALPFGLDGSLAYPERFVFALMVGLLLLLVIVGGAAVVGLGVTVLRAALAWRRERLAAPPLSRPRRLSRP